MRFLMKASFVDVDVEVTSVDEAVKMYEKICNDNFFSGDDLFYQIVILDDGKFVCISENGRTWDMEQHCTECISSNSPYGKAMKKLGYKGKFRD